MGRGRWLSARIRVCSPDATAHEYDKALSFFVGKLGSDLREDTVRGDGKRWVVVTPHGAATALLLARASGDPLRFIQHVLAAAERPDQKLVAL